MAAVRFHSAYSAPLAVHDLVRLAALLGRVRPRLELRTRAFFPQMFDRTLRPSSYYVAVVRLACAEIKFEVRRPYYYTKALIRHRSSPFIEHSSRLQDGPYSQRSVANTSPSNTVCWPISIWLVGI